MQQVDFDNLARDFPDALDCMKRNVKTRLRQLNEEDPLLEKLDQQKQDRSHKHIAKLCDMFFAAAAGEVETVREALENGNIDVNELDYEKRTALHLALDFDDNGNGVDLELAELLLGHGADPSARQY